MDALIGYTGFVGKNLDRSYQFDNKYNSKNIGEIEGKEYDLIVCSGVRAEKYLANAYPEEDMKQIELLINNLKKVKCKKFVLISTIDVYKIPINIDELSLMDTDGLHPYGLNRLKLEQFVQDYFKDYLIIRLPALIGQGLKKNFIYDMIHKIPSMIMENKFDELLSKCDNNKKTILLNGFTQDDRKNWILKKDLSETDRLILKRTLETLRFTSVLFTDHRSEFPFYNLENLWSDINIALKNNISILNIACEPVSARDISLECFGSDFTNIIRDREPAKYDMKSIHAKVYGNNKCYLYSKQEVIQSIKSFLKTYKE